MATYEKRAEDSLRQIRSELVGELEKIDEALIPFERNPSMAKRSRPAKPCCTKHEVTEIVARLLCDKQTLDRGEIEARAKKQARDELGKNLSGFSMRLKEALTDPLFTEFEPGRFRLAPIDGRPSHEN